MTISMDLVILTLTTVAMRMIIVLVAVVVVMGGVEEYIAHFVVVLDAARL